MTKIAMNRGENRKNAKRDYRVILVVLFYLSAVKNQGKEEKMYPHTGHVQRPNSFPRRKRGLRVVVEQ